MNNEHNFIRGSGNVFADLGIENADDELAKAELAYQIRTQIRERNLTQTQAADLLGTDQAKVSAIMNGKISGYTYDRLVRFLNKLNCDVTLIITPKADQIEGKVLVHVE